MTPRRAWAALSARRRQALRDIVLVLYGRTCHLCARDIDMRLRRPHPGSFSIDHVIPLDEGGAVFDPGNLRPAHLGCNAGRRPHAPAAEPQFTPKVTW